LDPSKAGGHEIPVAMETFRYLSDYDPEKSAATLAGLLFHKGSAGRFDAIALLEQSKVLKIFRKSSRKGIAPANRMPLKTRVGTTDLRGVSKGVG
jgi:hypothetical protein